MPARWTKAYTKLHRAKTKKSKAKDTAKYKAFRIEVLNRDLFTCVSCGEVGGYLEVHHLMPKKEYPDLIYDIDNGVTLCLECHFDSHPEKPRHRPWQT